MINYDAIGVYKTVATNELNQESSQTHETTSTIKNLSVKVKAGIICTYQSWAASVGVGFKPWILNQPGFCIWLRLVINPPDRYQAEGEGK